MNFLIFRELNDFLEIKKGLKNFNILLNHSNIFNILPGPDLKFIRNKFLSLNTRDIIILTSKNSVISTSNYLKENNFFWPQNINYIAVGKRTAETFQELTTFEATYPSSYSSENLLELNIFKHLANRTQNVLILAGNNGRKLIYKTLKERFMSVSQLEVYNIKWNENAIDFNQWKIHNYTHLVVTSLNQLKFLETHCSASNKLWFNNCTILLPSMRIKIEAMKMGFKDCIIVKNVSNKAIINKIIDIYNLSK
ncbi:hypothetical protein CF386_03545 [Paraphotobacterium marinum]|uniref:Uroporphyrinogen-III synthase n=1 Tax=Paraphotobacterium marinum TaxID=1755811 RepID=A0A220VD16_9GAMM|nr:uroporphyrinogen-III synthase [Paraphotobacterium marinum]ASK78171.1 hypothetical protein CF386_03545 [Paraphotobacterium marinum]